MGGHKLSCSYRYFLGITVSLVTGFEYKVEWGADFIKMFNKTCYKTYCCSIISQNVASVPYKCCTKTYDTIIIYIYNIWVFDIVTLQAK